MSEREYRAFRDFIEAHCSISLGDDKKYLLESRLARILAETGCQTFTDFHRLLSANGSSGLRDKIVDAVTTNETLWFRDGSHWEALRHHLLPDLVARTTNGKRRFRIWSAACSTGQEPYSIAMLVDDFCRKDSTGKLSPTQFEIVATDISPSALFIAMSGRYDAVSMRRGLTGDYAEFRQRYFERKGTVSEIKEDLKHRVSFKRFNLQDDFASLGIFDIVLIRYVAIYFSAEFKQNLFERIARAMTPNGCLVLGAAETLTEGASHFTAERHGRAYYFRRKGTL